MPAVSVAAPDSAFALETNPAGLADIRGWDVAFVHTDAAGNDRLLERGDSLYGATSLPLRFVLAGGLDWVRPDGFIIEDRGRFNLGLAWQHSRAWSVGTALRYTASEEPIGGVTSLDFGVTWRPSSTVVLGLVGHDLLGPLGLVTDDVDVPATFVLGAQLRPLADDRLSFEAIAAVDTDGRLGVRGIARVEVPRIGRLYGSIEVDDLRGDEDLRGIVGLEVGWGQVSAFGGSVIGDGDLRRGWQVGARLSARHREGLPTPGFVDEVEIRSMGARGTLALLDRLDRDRRDRRVRGVLLRWRTSGLGLANAQEVREAIGALEAAGKPVMCAVEAANGSQAYACSAARATFIDPAGNVRLLGPSIDVMLYGEILQRLGVRTDFVRIGDFKSAVEQYTNESMSAPARAQREAMLDDVYERLVHDMAASVERDESVVRRWIDEGPYDAAEAAELGLVETLDDADFGERLEAITGTSRRRTTAVPDASHELGRPRRIAVVVIDGALVDGDNVDYPIIEIHQSGGRTVSRTLDALAADRSIAAVVVRIDSPGGSVLASDQIWRAIRRLRRRKPVIASLGTVAASGGYYVASACDEIYADPSTITGSIGIFFGKADFQPLADEYGVNVTQLGRGRHAGAESLYRPFTGEERALLADKIRRFYRMFLRRVVAGRPELTVEEVDRVGRGRVWTGDAALELGLIDHLGGYLAALDRARELADVPHDAEVAFVPPRPSTLLDYVTAGLGLGGARGELDGPDEGIAAVRDTPHLIEALQILSVLGHSERDVPLAMMPGVLRLD